MLPSKNYLRIKVLIPLLQPLIPGFFLLRIGKPLATIIFRYERLSYFYYDRKRLGHTSTFCPFEPPANTNIPFGLTLRVNPLTPNIVEQIITLNSLKPPPTSAPPKLTLQTTSKPSTSLSANQCAMDTSESTQQTHQPSNPNSFNLTQLTICQSLQPTSKNITQVLSPQNPTVFVSSSPLTINATHLSKKSLSASYPNLPFPPKILLYSPSPRGEHIPKCLFRSTPTYPFHKNSYPQVPTPPSLFPYLSQPKPQQLSPKIPLLPSNLLNPR